MKLQCIKIEKGQSFEITDSNWIVERIFDQPDGALVVLRNDAPSAPVQVVPPAPVPTNNPV